ATLLRANGTSRVKCQMSNEAPCPPPSALRRSSLPHTLFGSPVPLPEVRPAGGWLLEPDAAVIRAGLGGDLAERLGGWAIDPSLAYLSTGAGPETPFGRVYRIEAPEPFSLKALGERLRRLEAGDVVLKTRGSAADPETLRHALRRVLKHGRPDYRPVVF